MRGGRRHRAPLDLLEVQRLGSVLDDDGVGANHFGGGAAARLDSQHLEPLPRPCRSVATARTRGYGDRHIGIGESEQRTSAGRVKVEQLTARALDATETIIHWSEGRAATQPWPVVSLLYFAAVAHAHALIPLVQSNLYDRKPPKRVVHVSM